MPPPGDRLLNGKADEPLVGTSVRLFEIGAKRTVAAEECIAMSP
jgi:hypothetical protein